MSGSLSSSRFRVPPVDAVARWGTFRQNPINVTRAGELQVQAFQAAELVEADEKSRGTYYPFWEAEKFLKEAPPGRGVPVFTIGDQPIARRGQKCSMPL